MLVLGGAGFIGRHAVEALLHVGASVIIGSRNPKKLLTPRTFHTLPKIAAEYPVVEVRLETLLEPEHWRSLIKNVDVILNCVGILRPVGSATYEHVHRLAPRALAMACAQAGKRFIHISALGLHADARSRFLTSIFCGKAEVRQHGKEWIIVRPSLLDGRGGFGAWWLRAVARLPVFVVPANVKGRIAALRVTELGEALTRLCLASGDELRLGESREFELGGPENFDLEHYVRRLRTEYSDQRALCIPIPGLIARLIAHACDVIHFTPFSFGHWELLTRDNAPAVNRLAELLGREPGRIGEAS